MRYILNGDFDDNTYGGAVCLACSSIKKNGDGGVFLLSEDEWGEYKICESCVTEMAAELGMLEAEKADKLRKRNRVYGQELKAAKEEIEHYRGIISNFYGPEETA